MIFSTTRTVESMSTKQKVLLIIGIFLCMELGLMVSTEFSIALPSIIQDIGGAQFYSLVFTVNLAMSAIITPIVGKLSDIYGRRKILILGILVILISEILTPLLVSNIYHLMFFRALQGMGGAATAVVGLIIISDIFDLENRARFLGFYGSLNALTTVVAPTVGGIFVQYYSWHWVFYSIVPVGIIGLAIVLKLMPEIPKFKGAKLDYLGVAILSLAVLSLIAITSFGGSYISWGSMWMIGLFALLILSVILFIFSQKKAADPVIPLRIFKYRVFTVCLLALLACMFAQSALIFFLPLILQNVHGFTPTEAGLFMTYRGIIAFICAAVGGLLVAKLKDFKLVAISAMSILIGIIFVLTFFTQSGTSLAFTIISLIWGMAAGVLVSIFQTGVQLNLPKKEISVAMGVMQLVVALGAMVATSTLGILLKNENLSLGFSYVLFTILGIMIAALILFIVLIPWKRPNEIIEPEHVQKEIEDAIV